MPILGISAYYHDSAAALIVDGKIIAAAQEERFTRIKHDSNFPHFACKYVLEEAGIEFKDLSAIAFYDKPFIKFERLLETYVAFAPKGLKSFWTAIPVWIKEKFFMKKMLRDEFQKLGAGKTKIPLFFPEHHLSHAASAFYPSPFQDAAILTLDGVGEWATATICKGENNSIKILEELAFPHSIGLLYSAFTYFLGFRVNSGEYKLMGLAPYGNPNETLEFKEIIKNNLLDMRADGSILLNMKYFSFATGLRMTPDKKWKKLFGFPRRKAEGEINQKHKNLALAIQEITEEIVLKLVQTAKEKTKSKNLVLAGGVALNCVANGKILQSKIFDKVWIQPAAGDAGGALGAALSVWHIHQNKSRKIIPNQDKMQGSYLGPKYSKNALLGLKTKYNAVFESFENFESLANKTAELIADGNVIGWFQGRMEFGPRALGNRSIIGDARNPEMQKKMNLKIKYRESFRPFAPSVLEEDLEKYFELKEKSPYMLLVAPVQKEIRNPEPPNYQSLDLKSKLYHNRSKLPAITHVDYSARIQSVSAETNPRYYQLLKSFKEKTGFGVLVNTSFNVRGEPIVCSPDDAYRCFMRTEMDYLVINNCLFKKSDQEDWKEKDNWQETFKLD